WEIVGTGDSSVESAKGRRTEMKNMIGIEEFWRLKFHNLLLRPIMLYYTTLKFCFYMVDRKEQKEIQIT
ncbi:MAG: hypothetical protein NC430_13345, partial [bacterium]|nr:hypothetical protein [bacterium]